MNRKGHQLEKHHAWQGDAARDEAKRKRARRRFPLAGVQCERCKAKPATDRHHVDGDTGNNDRSNLAFLCRRCHMEVDGRIERVRLMCKALAEKNRTPPRPCVRCGVPSKPTRKGRCGACNTYLRKNGIERPERLFA